MTKEQLDKRIQKAYEDIRAIIRDEGIWCDTSLYAYLYMASDALTMAITRTNELRRSHDYTEADCGQD